MSPQISGHQVAKRVRISRPVAIGAENHFIIRVTFAREQHSANGHGEFRHAAASTGGERRFHEHGIALPNPGRQTEKGACHMTVIAKQIIEPFGQAAQRAIELHHVTIFMDGQQVIPGIDADETHLRRRVEPFALSRRQLHETVGLGVLIVQHERNFSRYGL